VDISLNITNGVSSARTVKRFSEQMPALKPIMLLIKQFLTQRGLNEVFTGGLSSYSLMIMTVSFLQVNILWLLLYQ
jgi:non-canonical poly(A) RNA polymerase PAPD5/7